MATAFGPNGAKKQLEGEETMPMSCSTDDPEYEISSADRELPQVQYEYLDHPADVQLHAWGESLEVAFEQVTMAMFAYMTDINTVTIESHMDVEVEGMDMQSLLYQLMDELLFNFCADPYFIPRKVKILQFDKSSFKIKARAFGETFNLKKHPQGTEVKAITYSNMQVYDTIDKHEVFVIIDI